MGAGKYWNESWNCILGCEKDSDSCRNCWALTMARRGAAQDTEYGGTCGHVIEGSALVGLPSEWNGEHYFSKKALDKPLHWKKPRVVAVNWMGDMFRTKVLNEWRVEVWRRMILASQHQYLVLTKRAENMATWLLSDGFCDWRKRWPGASDHIWHGASVCNQAEANAKIHHLQRIHGRRWLSLEPLLSAIDLLGEPEYCCSGHECGCRGLPIEPSLLCGIGFVVVGAETGPGARECKAEWVQSIVDQCQAAGVPVWVKQAPLPRPPKLYQTIPTYAGKAWPCEKPEGMP